MIWIYSTFPNKKEAQKIGKELIRQKLVACVNIFPIESIYSWPASAKASAFGSTKSAYGQTKSAGKQEKIINDKEFAVIIKTKKENFRKIEKFILKNHSYKTPCILEIPIGRVSPKYQQWLNGVIK